MDDDAIKRAKKFLDSQEDLAKRFLDGQDRVKKIIDGENKLQSILDAQERINKLLSPASEIAEYMDKIKTPNFDLLETINSSAVSKFLSHENMLSKAIATYATRFELPKIPIEIDRIFASINHSRLAELQNMGEHFSHAQKTIALMTNPWLDTLDATRSIRGLVEMQVIGSALNAVPSFGTSFTDSLRFDFGDWRDQITWPGEIFTDVSARTAFYVDQGFNTELTAFPEPAFYESLLIAGVMSDPPSLVARYGPPVPVINNEEDEAAFARTNIAHDWLQKLETQLREFVHKEMTKAFGEKWPRQKLPKDMYEKWVNKKKTAEDRGGEQWPLIAYADFTDYELIICNKGNWPVFQSIFKRPENVKESFQRMYPIRICTMHARLITQDDHLFLYVETKRLMSALLRLE